ncbi:hypothetical protein TRIP_D420143 [uncultured Paludibacter sp.]|nr:hypothetical protein TRIP_D420143 [uncultured Paludibacter sp.]
MLFVFRLLINILVVKKYIIPNYITFLDLHLFKSVINYIIEQQNSFQTIDF